MNQRIAITWGELLLILFGVAGSMSLWKLAPNLVGTSGPVEKDIIEHHYGVADHRRAVAAAEEEWKAYLELLVKQRLEVERLTMLTEPSQAVSSTICAQSGGGNAQGDAAGATQCEALRARDQAARLEARIATRLGTLTRNLGEAQEQFSFAQRSADLEHDHARDAIQRRHWARATTWGAVMAGTSLIFFAVGLSLLHIRRAGIRRELVVLTSAAVLALLILYDLLGLQSVAVLSVLAIAALSLLVRQQAEGAPK